MLCPQASELMSLRLDNLLEEAEQRALDEHFMTCSSCRAEWQAMQRACAFFEGVPSMAPSTALSSRIMGRVRRHLFWDAFLRKMTALLIGLLAFVGLGVVPSIGVLIVTLNNPSITSALLGVSLRLVEILGTILAAVWLMLRALLSQSSSLIAVAYLLLATVLALTWMYLVSHQSCVAWRRIT